MPKPEKFIALNGEFCSAKNKYQENPPSGCHYTSKNGDFFLFGIKKLIFSIKLLQNQPIPNSFLYQVI